jgi:integrase
VPHVAPPIRRRKRQRGSIRQLPSGALQVRVYVGRDPVTKRRRDFTEVIPAGPKAGDLADAALARMLTEIREKRRPRTSATLNQLLDRHWR